MSEPRVGRIDSPSPIFVITATYNESENLPALYRRLREAAPDAHWVIVDDASPDGTGQVACELRDADPLVHVIERSAKLGYASAHQEGMRYALKNGAAVIVTMDADLSHNPATIPAMVGALADYEVVVGSRYAPGGGFENVSAFRRAISAFANLYVRAILRLTARDCTSGFRAYRAEIIEKADILREGPRGYAFLTETLWLCARAGASIGELPITYAPREAGQSKMSLRVILESAWRTVALRFPRLFRRKLAHPDPAAQRHTR